MRIVAVDPSLTASGLATPEQVTTLRPPPKMVGPERLAWIRDQVEAVLRDPTDGWANTLVVLEGYSYASPHQAHQLGELGGILRVALWEAGIPYVEIPPTTLKKFATGDGFASKDKMREACNDRLGLVPFDEHQADAIWAREAGLTYYDLPGMPALPKANRETLWAIVKKGPRKGEPIINWPELPQRASV